jgi:hypothetical protein
MKWMAALEKIEQIVLHFFALQKACNAPSSLSFSGDRKNS